MDFKLKHILIAVMIVAACSERYEIFDDLGISSHTLNIAQTPGETHIAVYSTGPWSVALDSYVDWASVNKVSGEGLGDFVFSWSANYGVARSVNILVSKEGKTETINVIQAGLVTSPYISLDRSKVVLPRQETKYSVPMKTNLGYSVKDFRGRAVYYNEKADTLEIGSDSPSAWVSSCDILSDRMEFTIKTNTSGKERRADLMVYMPSVSGPETYASVSIFQSEADPEITLASAAGDYYANGERYHVASERNNIWSLEGVSVTSDCDWIKDAALEEEGLSFTTLENSSGAPRQGTVTVSYTSGGLSTAASYVVRQGAGKLLGFKELRSRVPGTIRGNLLLEGFVVSDSESPNLCSSPQTGQFEFDRNENYRTAYLESTDGEYGLCLKFNEASDNSIPRWSKVQVSLDGAVLERTGSPSRYTLSGISAANFTIVDDGSAVPEKVKRISQLTDADIFTYVTLTDVEIMCKDGAYTNASEGYSLNDELNAVSGTAKPRWDVAPLLCSDVSGDVIYMLTNAAAPWRRTGEDVVWGSCVPQGSGNLGGIIVADDVVQVRWGNVGRYQIRPLRVEEIALDSMPFSNTICEWTWNGNMETLEPDLGKGSIKKYDAATRFTWDYNNPYLPTEDSPNGYDQKENRKGMVALGALCLTQKWWDFTLGQGKYFDVEFTTAGLSGSNIVLGIVWGHGTSATAIAAPSHWKVLYSSDGGNSFSEVPSAGILKQRTCAWWNNPATSQDSTPGYTEHLVKLPQSCFGKSKVVVRLEAADTVTDITPSTGEDSWKFALGIEKGTIGAADEGPVRIGTITVRYN